MIESRTANDASTYCKIFTQGKASRPKKSINDRPSKGTTVSVFDFMYNMPVRKKSISESLDINECRRALQCIALMYPQLSYSLESEATRETCFQFKKSQSLPLAFAQLFGKVRVGCLKSFHHQVDDYEINGYVSTDYHTSKDLQFLYVNKRCVLKTRLQKLINSILGQVLNCKQRLKVDPLKSTPESPVKSQIQFFIYVINIICPYSKCDIIFEPRRTIIEFSEWDKVLKVTEDAILNFLKSEKLISSAEECTSTVLDGNNALPQNNFDSTACANGLFSNAVKRLNPQIGEPSMFNIKETRSKNTETNEFASFNPISGISDHLRQDFTVAKLQEKKSSRNVTISTSLNKTNQNLICLKNTKSNASILDTLKFQNGKRKSSLSGNTENSDTVSFASQVPDIPNRSVFPVDSPVMLRIPVPSTLSDLGKSQSDGLLRLREKYNFTAKTKTKRLSVRMSTSHKNHSRLNKTGKVDEKFKFPDSVKVKNRSVQCPSLSQDIHSRLPSENSALLVSVTKNKSIQCPSVQGDETPVCDTGSFLKPVSFSRMDGSADTKYNEMCNVLYDNLFDNSGKSVKSRFEFRDQPNTFQLQKSNFFNRFNRKYIAKTSHQKDDRGEGSDTSDIKRLKSSSSSGSFSPEYHCIQEENNVKHSFEDVSNLIHNSKTENYFSCIVESDKDVLSSLPSTGSSASHCENCVSDNTGLTGSNIFLQPFVNTFHDFVDKKASSFNFVEDIKDGLKTNKVEGSEEENLEDIPPTSTGEFSVSNSACVSELVKIASEMPFSSFSSSINDSSTESKTPVHGTKQIALPVAGGNPEENVNSNIAPCRNSEFFTNSSSSNENGSSACKTREEIDCCRYQDSVVALSPENESESSNMDMDNVLENTVSALVTEDIEEHISALPVKDISEEKAETDLTAHQSSSPPAGNVEMKKIPSRWILQKDPINGRVVYIDSVTGNSSYETPECVPEGREINSELEKGSNAGHFFLSHDFSPFLAKRSAEKIHCDNEPTSNEQAELRNKLNSFVKEQENDEVFKKWRIPQENSENRVEDMLVKWQNPMFEVPSEVNCVEDNKYSENLPQMYCILNSYRFSKSTLENLKVIGQVDCKFIACVVSNINENNTNQNLLVLFDQHAVHERVRLEELTEELYEINEHDEKIVKTASLTVPLRLVLETEEIRLLRTYHINLQKLGIHISFSEETGVVLVHSIPSCFVDKATNKLKRKLAEIEVVIENTIKEWLNMLARTRAASYVLPKSLCAVLNSQACRGAVKFGDPLSLSECRELLVSLANCKLPFQCAHGRPSIAPILDLNKVVSVGKKRSAPQLSNIKKLLC